MFSIIADAPLTSIGED